MPPPAIRRVVTGHNDRGLAVVALDEVVQGQIVTQIWGTDTLPSNNVDDWAYGISQPGPTIPGGSALRFVDINPGFRSAMHRTSTIDYVFILEGELDVELDGGEVVHLKGGDIVIHFQGADVVHMGDLAFRERHPFEGRSLAVLGWTHRRGALHLVLVLPDGTRSLIPASWTDLHDDAQPSTRPDQAADAPLASVAHLLCMRTVVDALLRRLPASASDASKPEESDRAIADELPRDATGGERRAGVADAGASAEGRGRRDARAADRKGLRAGARRRRRQGGAR